MFFTLKRCFKYCAVIIILGAAGVLLADYSVRNTMGIGNSLSIASIVDRIKDISRISIPRWRI